MGLTTTMIMMITMTHASTIEMASITKAHQPSKDFGFQYNNKPYDVFGGAREIEIESKPPLPRTGNRQASILESDGSSQRATNKHQQNYNN